jgi:5,10-methylenetetrahydromethanopterin reductase
MNKYADGLSFSIEFIPSEDYLKTIYHGVLAEKSGFDCIWVTHHFNNLDVYIVLTTIANYTNRILLGPGVTNPYLYHPVLNASTVLSLDKISGGRAVFGIGAGDKTTLDSAGIERKNPVETIEESIEIIRGLLRGERVNYNGRIYKIPGVALNIKADREIPVYVGAQGPRMLEMAGRVSDGVLVNASHEKDLEFAIRQINKGKGERRRKIDVSAFTCFSVDSDPKKAKKAARPMVAFIVAGSHRSILERHNIPREEIDTIKGFLTEGKYKKAFESVTDHMMDSFCIYGTPKECLQKIEELEKLGVSQIVIGSPIGPDKEKSIKLIRDKIMPAVRI